MARVYQIKNPANNELNDIPLEDNAVLLSGFCSDVGVISNGKLCVNFLGDIQALYGNDGQSNVFFNDYYPIGSPIYVYVGSGTFQDEDVFSEKFYSSYYNVPINDNGGAWDHMDDKDDVFLVVELNADKTMWTPIALIGTSELNPSYHTGKCLIRLGSTKGQYNTPPYTDCNMFAMTEYKPMFYYNGTNLVPFDAWLLSQSQNYFRNFKLPDTTTIELTVNNPMYQWEQILSSVPTGQYLFSGQVVLATDSTKPVMSHVLLRYKINSGNYVIVSAADTVVPITQGSVDGVQTVFLQGVINLPTSPSTLHLEMLMEAEVGTTANVVYVVNNPPISGTYIELFDVGAQLFFQRVGNAI